jgi:putative Mg2+ transporter-C (MgtC) family protein
MIGIGFIGAGTIIAFQGKIKGLVNAASIGVAAAVGITVEVRSYLSSIVATLFFLIIFGLRRFERIE